MAKAILLTGGTGFLGRQLAAELAVWARHKRLKALVRPPLERPAVHRLRELGFQLIPADLGGLDPAELAPQLRDVEAILHLAGILEGGRKLLLATNYHGTARLLAAARTAGVKRIIHLSSIGATANPQFPYAHSAWLAEEEVRQSGLEFVIFRPTVLIGPGAPFTAGLIRMVRRWPIVLLPKSRTKFQPLSVGDMVRCLLRVLELQEMPHETIELGGPEIVTLEELVRIIQARLGLRKRIIYLPRRPLRLFIRTLRRLGCNTPLVSSHLIGTDNAAGPGSVRTACGFKPQPLRQVLNLHAGGEVSILRRRGEG